MSEETKLALQEMNAAIESLIKAVNLLNSNDQALLAKIIDLQNEAGIQAERRVSH